MTISHRLILIFTICLSFMAASTFFHYHNVFDLKHKLNLIERLNDLRDDMLELRRYEKNVFLAGDASSVERLTFYLDKTTGNLRGLTGQILTIMGNKWLDRYRGALKSYETLVRQGIDAAGRGLPVQYSDTQLREKGKLLNDYTEELITTKRRRIDRAVTSMLVIPVVFSILFFTVFAVMLNISQQNISKPLEILQTATEKISTGVFEPVPYRTSKHDEVSKCLAAFNRMTREIQIRQDQLLHSRKMASIGTFTSGIAHELNNPINNISLIVDTLVEDDEDLSHEERITLYQDLMGQADRAAEIVKSLLEFSRTDQEHLEMLSLEEIIDKTVRLVKNKINLQQIKFEKIIKTPPGPIWIDKSRLQQALLNLLINGIQAMPDGGRLTITLDTGETADEVRIDVADTGVGIPKEHLESIFDPFFTTKKEGEGTGLGLSVTYGIIQKHGGRISVESKPGEGTCFSIFLSTKEDHESKQLSA